MMKPFVQFMIAMIGFGLILLGGIVATVTTAVVTGAVFAGIGILMLFIAIV